MFSDRLLRFLFPTSLGSALLMAGAVALGFVPGSGLFFTVLFFVVLVSCATSFLLLHREGGGGFGFRADSQEPSENHTLFEARRLLVSEAGREMASSLNLESVEDKAMGSLRQIFGARAVFIMLYDRTSARLRMHRYQGVGEEYLREMELSWGEGISGRVFATGEAEYVPDLRAPEELRFSEEMKMAGMESLWTLPLTFNEERLGVLGLFLPSPAPGRNPDLGSVANEGERELGRVFAQQLALALLNARYYRRLEKAVEVERRHSAQLGLLNDLAVTLNSGGETGPMLDDFLTGATRITGAAQGFLYLQRGDRLELEAFHGDPESTLHPPPRSPQSDEVRNLAEKATEERRVVRLSQESTQTDEGFLGFLAVPVLDVSGEPLGCLVEVGDSTGYGFTMEDELLTTSLASHLAVALQNLQRFQEERKVTEYLQRAMLPEIPRVRGLSLDLCYESATKSRLVGGDFYDVLLLPRGRVCLVVGDVCGKGLDAAAQMATVRYVIRAYAALDLSPGTWMRLVNESLIKEWGEYDFITALMAVVDPSQGSIRYALAGHPPAVLADGGETKVLGGVPGVPLGVQESANYETYAAKLPQNATMVLFTDGLYEARRDAELFGEEAMTDAVIRESRVGISGGARRLVGSARDFAGGSLEDDVVVMLVRLSQGNRVPPSAAKRLVQEVAD